MNWRTGLDYGWWKNRDVWAAGASVLMLIIAGVVLFLMWFLGWGVPN